MEEEKRKCRRTGIGAALALIAVGTILLMVKNGLVSREFLSQWWQLTLVATGAWLLVNRLLRHG